MNFQAIGMIIAVGLSQNPATDYEPLEGSPAWSAVAQYNEAKDKATETLIGELGKAISQAKAGNNAGQLPSLEQLKQSLEAGATVQDVFKLREKLGGSKWSVSKTYDWDRNGTPYEFTETEVLVSTEGEVKRFAYHVLGPDSLHCELGRFVFRDEFRKLIRMTDGKLDFRPGERLSDGKEEADDSDKMNPLDGARTSSQAVLDYEYAIGLARKRLDQELPLLQREAIQGKELALAVSIQRLRENLAAGEPVPEDHPELRKALNNTAWIYGILWKDQGRHRFRERELITSNRLETRTRKFMPVGKRSVQFAGRTVIYFNEDFSRFLLVSEKSEIRTGIRLK